MPIRLVTFIAMILTFLLINLGGLVHNSESSLACPDWPLCYGQVFPKMEGGILIEHSHRLLASLVGLFTIAVLFLSFKQRKTNSLLFKFSILALVLVIFQGVLGGLTVIFKLPTMISTAHLATSMIFLCTLIYLHHLQGNPSLAKIEKNKWDNNLRSLLFLTIAGVYSQMLLGALMRHLGLGVACGLGVENSVMCFDPSLWVRTFIPVTIQSQIHMAHRYYAIIVGALVIFTSFKLVKFLKQNKLPSLMALLPIPLVVLQIILGIMSVSFNIGLISTTLHLGGAAILLGILWKNFLTVKDLEKNSFTKIENSKLSDIFSLTKPRLSSLVILTSALGLWLAPGNISFFKALISIFATSGLVGGACVINCYMEKDIDGLMERTKDRPLPSGRMNPEIALKFGLFLIISCLATLFFVINPLTGILGLIATLVYIFLYTPLKKKTSWALFAGAIPGAIPPLMGWTSVTGSIGTLGLVLFAILFIWQLPHFLSISIYHANDYDNADLKIFPTHIGMRRTINRIAIYTFALFLISLVPYLIGSANEGYRNFIFLLGGAFFVYSLLGYRPEKDSKDLLQWARRYFYASLVYLPCVFILMIFFK